MHTYCNIGLETTSTSCPMTMLHTYLLVAATLPGPLTVTNLVDADDLFNFTTGTPGSCQCELPLCNGNAV